MDWNALVRVVLYLVPLILSLTLHEYAHAYAARKLGDDTARMMGRMTLNPLSHIDLLGTLLLPGLLLYWGMPPFGWAKPVPFNPLRFRRDIRMSTGTMIVAAAGPISNLLIAVACAGALGIAGRAGVPMGEGLVMLFSMMVGLNVILALFNLIPVPPLDGSKVLFGLLPDRLHGMKETMEQFSFVFFILLFKFGGELISGPYQVVMRGLSALMGG